MCCVLVSDVGLCSSLGRFALSCSVVLWLSGGNFVREDLSGSQALLERDCFGQTGPVRELSVRDL